MTQASNVISLPLPGSTRPTIPPETSVPAPHPLEGDQLAKSVSSVVAGLGHGLSRSGGSGGGNWLAGFIVAVGIVMIAAVGWMGVQLQDMRNVVESMRTEQVALVQAQAARDEVQNDAIFALHDNQRAMDKWTQRIMLDMWRKLNPDREPPTPPDTDSDDRVFLNLR